MIVIVDNLVIDLSNNRIIIFKLKYNLIMPILILVLTLMWIYFFHSPNLSSPL